MGSRLRMSMRPDPRGPHRAGSVGPKITTPDAPTAAARCDTPESLPTKIEASRAIAATVGRSRSRKTGTRASRKTGSIEVSAGPRTTTMLARFDNEDASAANLSAGQFLAGLPLPGKITIRFERSHLDFASTREAAARSSGVGSRRVSIGRSGLADSAQIARRYMAAAIGAERMERHVGVGRLCQARAKARIVRGKE